MVTEECREAEENVESRVVPDVMVYLAVQGTAVLRVNEAKVGPADHLGGQDKWVCMD